MSKHPGGKDPAASAAADAGTDPTQWEADYGDEAEDEEELARIRRRRRLKARAGRSIGDQIRELNLTAMMDMMTILLVFLLKSYAEQPENLTISDKLTPPFSTATSDVQAAVTITVTAEEILVDNKPVVNLKEDGLPADPQGQGRSTVIPSLFESLQERAAQLKSLEERGGAPFDGRLLLVADKSAPYRLVTAVLYTAGQAHFSQYRLVVQKASGGK
ncbi:biopolymer transporter ExbD [Myxococcota bacterium]|nr:biopolymer transporter ExbD [Myxococcota bacterium]